MEDNWPKAPLSAVVFIVLSTLMWAILGGIVEYVMGPYGGD